MVAYVIRRLLWNVPIYLGILLFVMLLLRAPGDPAYGRLGKNATDEDLIDLRKQMGLHLDWYEQYYEYVSTLSLTRESLDRPGQTVADLLSTAVWPSLALTVPALVLTALLSIVIGLVSAFNRGKPLDRLLMTLAVLGMSVSFLVYIILGQYFGSYKLAQWTGVDVFAIQGYEPGAWLYYCLLPVLISTVVSMGYDTRFYRAVMVEEVSKDYIRTARAKGLPESRVMFVHMLRNAMIAIVTRIMITLPFLVMGSILLEMFFNIPGMGKVLITAIQSNDFPVVQGFVAVFAVLFIASNILTDVLYGVVDPRVRLS